MRVVVVWLSVLGGVAGLGWAGAVAGLAGPGSGPAWLCGGLALAGGGLALLGWLSGAARRPRRLNARARTQLTRTRSH